MTAIDKLIFNALVTGGGVVLPTFGTLHTLTTPPKRLTNKSFSAPRIGVVYTSKESANYPSIITLICNAAKMPEMSARERYDEWANSNTKNRQLTISGVGVLGSDGFVIDKSFDSVLNPLSSDKVELHSRRKLWPLCIVLILIATVGAVAYCYVNGLFGPLHYSSTTDKTVEIVSQPAQTSQQGVASQQSASESSQQADATSEEVLQPEDVIQQELQEYSESTDQLSSNGTSPVYRLVAGVFSSQENAAKFIFSDPLRLGADGYVTMPFKGGKIAVCIYSSESIKEVEQRNAQYKNLKADMWIWKDE